MEDNLAAMGVGGREAQLLGGYENLIKQAPPKLAVRIKPLREGPVVFQRVRCDPNVLAGLTVHTADHKEFGLAKEPKKARYITVVAAQHGCGVSRLSRRFFQHEVMRFDRLARAFCGMEDYHRPSGDDVVDSRIHSRVERTVAERLASGTRPSLRMLLTHERPQHIVDALRRVGIGSHWVLYTPAQVEVAKRIASRNLVSGILRYMQKSWCELYEAVGCVAQLESEEEVIDYNCKMDTFKVEDQSMQRTCIKTF
jgi:hypothetical protein